MECEIIRNNKEAKNKTINKSNKKWSLCLISSFSIISRLKISPVKIQRGGLLSGDLLYGWPFVRGWHFLWPFVRWPFVPWPFVRTLA